MLSRRPGVVDERVRQRVDEDLQALERGARASPEDLTAGRAFADALLRRGDRRACFAELTRLARAGHRESRADVSRWNAWTGATGNGGSHHAECRPVEGQPRVEVKNLPGTKPWRVSSTEPSSVVLHTLPCTRFRSHVECMRLDTLRLEPTWTIELLLAPAAHSVPSPHGEDLYWVDRGDGGLFVLPGAEGPPHETRALPRCSGLLLGFANGDALVCVDDDDSPFRSRVLAVPLLTATSGPRWSQPLRGFALGVWAGRALIQCRVDRDGVPIPLVELGRAREYWNTLELLDPATGDVHARSTPLAERLEVLAWDDDDLLVRRGRQVELHERLGAPPSLCAEVAPDGRAPGPVLTPREVVFVTRNADTMTSENLELRVLERRTGAVRWSTPYPLARLTRSTSQGGTSSAPPIRGAIAAAGRTLYTAREGESEVTVTSYDLDSGARGFEVSFAAAVDPATPTIQGQAVHMQAVQLVPVDGALLVVAATETGSLIARIG